MQKAMLLPCRAVWQVDAAGSHAQHVQAREHRRLLHLWYHEYHCAALAGKVLNTVGEVDDKAAQRQFQERHRSRSLHGRRDHRLFSFRNEAGHVFACNGYPPTEDQSRVLDRWTGIEFRHTRPPEKRDDRLAEKIVCAELPGVLAWRSGVQHFSHRTAAGSSRRRRTRRC
jgi:hypothetical protein